MRSPSLMRTAVLAALLLVGAAAPAQDNSMARQAQQSEMEKRAPDGGGGSSSTPPPQMSVRIVTWNVHPTSVGGETPEDRIIRLIQFGQTHRVDIMALQEVPRTLFNDQARLQRLSAAVTGAGYELLAIRSEYPPIDFNTPRRPTAERQNAYVVIYNPAVVEPQQPPFDPTDGGLAFHHPEAFEEGALLQARPPVGTVFNVHHPNNQGDSVLRLLSWHNEAGTHARGHVEQLQQEIQNELEPPRIGRHEDWVVVGDFNVQDVTEEMQELDRDYQVLTHDDGIDHIITNAPLNNVINDDPALNIDQQFRSTGRHLALFGELLLSAPRP